MSPLFSDLSMLERRQLDEDLNYLNMDEIRILCGEHSIPYEIWIETTDGGRRKTRDQDRKGVILDRIRHYLNTGEVPDATCFPARVVSFDELADNLEPTDRLFYDQYDKTNRAMTGLLEKLTGGQFKNGAIARILAREFWSRGIAPTFQEYAQAWLSARDQHTDPNPEWAFLADRAKGRDTTAWKAVRTEKALAVFKLLSVTGDCQKIVRSSHRGDRAK
jgi:hypothetical protein